MDEKKEVVYGRTCTVVRARKTITASMKEREKETTDVATNRSDYILIMKNSSKKLA
jgi:hypothetical protein